MGVIPKNQMGIQITLSIKPNEVQNTIGNCFLLVFGDLSRYRDEGRKIMELFDNNHRYTNEALRLENEIRSALRPIFEAALAKGVSPRELAYLTFQAGNDLSLESLLCGPLSTTPKE